ncbi:MAG: SDR family oxidoreductase [Chloroflexota bacterium]|nr:SDR family oxidoreductase [Chloroflexota bacterium]
MDLEGQVAIVTGAGKPESIGRAAALGLARQGASVVIGDLYEEGFEGAVQAIERLGRRCLCVKMDAANQAAVQAMVHQAARAFNNKIDVLINAVGGSWAITAEDLNQAPSGEQFVGVTNCTLEQWRTIVGANLDSAFYAAQAVAPYMYRQRYGRIVNFSSIAARRGVKPDQDSSSSGPYAVAKAGIIGLTKQLALEMAPYGVTVNCVAPGVIASWRMKAREGSDQRMRAMRLRSRWAAWGRPRTWPPWWWRCAARRWATSPA